MVALEKAQEESEKRIIAEKEAASEKAAREMTERASQKMAADEAVKRG